jgi:hypothetical protein
MSSLKREIRKLLNEEIGRLKAASPGPQRFARMISESFGDILRTRTDNEIENFIFSKILSEGLTDVDFDSYIDAAVHAVKTQPRKITEAAELRSMIQEMVEEELEEISTYEKMRKASRGERTSPTVTRDGAGGMSDKKPLRHRVKELGDEGKEAEEILNIAKKEYPESAPDLAMIKRFM